MLVIGREIGEIIAIDDHIKIKVLSVDGNTVRFGISAPRHVEVHRAEIYKRIVEQLAKQAVAG
ncbi:MULTISPECIES: carbon storage regulator CsrA [Pseudomonas]|uniref:Translational regulator CsrA n=1 Tax=Pseudomonas donghuensis TaxID=1163398 RepID=A0AAP0SEX1_9PSED|nr:MULTISPECIES: carbon storage regulator CsrA [Pseudomonas]MDF9894778.1 carbon storage regulator [Pseudomonas vranovensis]KDN97894.1 carbon storage regulator CsrA [Pseudomonas donghuensis]MBF4208498.1 carbon storage regulator [Pseudomonas donghuensis]MBS7597243.1 carbon storage regulator CsrA [Pseudomonas sp. RC2C2]MCP3752151.1 carbon storage regulator CsrA [Pseudomonas sp. SBB6]